MGDSSPNPSYPREFPTANRPPTVGYGKQVSRSPCSPYTVTDSLLRDETVVWGWLPRAQSDRLTGSPIKVTALR